MSENSAAGYWSRPQAGVTRAWRSVSAQRTPLLLVSSVTFGAALLIGRLDQGWWPHDDGSLAHSAERVLAGELPHRDFAELYTGFLTFLNAGVFAIAGEDVFNLRIPLFLAFLGFIGSFYAVARRLAGAVWGFVATLVAITWSVPVYPAPLPSWYLLFLCTAGIYAVTRFFETEYRLWLLAAGACGGLAMTIKVVGVWYVVAVGLVLLVEPLLRGVENLPRQASRTQGQFVMAAAACAFLLATAVLGGHASAGNVVGLLLPVATLCIAVGINGYRTFRAAAMPSAAPRARELGIFLIGVAVPVALFAAPYVATSSLDSLLDGIFVAPQSRFEYAALTMPPPQTLLWGVPLVGLFWLRSRVTQTRRLLLIDVVLSCGIAFLVATASDDLSYSWLWNTTRAAGPFVVAIGALALVKQSGSSLSSARLVASVVLVGGFATLSQFPFSAPVYFCYVAPLLLLAAIAALQSFGQLRGLLPAVIFVALAVFGYRQLDTQSIASLGRTYIRDPQVSTLSDNRASILVTPTERLAYQRVMDLVAQHRGDTRALFAGPDTPEIYFLTESHNPSRSIMDFVDLRRTTLGTRLIRLLRHEQIPVVVLNHDPEQSPPLDPDTIAAIRATYAHSERAGQFEVRWRP